MQRIGNQDSLDSLTRRKNIFILIAHYAPCFPWYFREWLTIPSTTTDTIISRLLIYRMENRRSWRLLSLSIIWTRPLIHPGANRKTDRLLKGISRRGKVRVTKSTAIGGTISRRRNVLRTIMSRRGRAPVCWTCLRNEVDRIRGIAIQLISDVAARRLI